MFSLLLYLRLTVADLMPQSDSMGNTSHCISKRAYALGWTLQYTANDFIASITPEIDAILASGQEGVGRKFRVLFTRIMLTWFCGHSYAPRI